MRRALLTLCGALVLAGCANEPRLGETAQPMSVTKLDDLPPPSGTDLVAATAPYRIGPLDKLNIAVFGMPELTGSFQTDAAGHLSMALVGEIDASGKTPKELATSIDQRLRGIYVRDPQVTVNLGETTSQVFTVDGQVGQPGSYPAIGNITLMRAVANAKGAGDYARLDDVVVFRTVEGRSLAALYNLGAIRRGLYPDPRIYANDIIIVGDSKARRMFEKFLQIAPLLTTPLVLALERVR
ncbi:polysaccharide biosynthesis/export family protein [Sphingomonas sp.]|uniref:polysaccharide biosynthesis/export family protein n=1 Tax=Sphingomonas sp. TaxID=28214 RepID=UPI002E3192DD|nr:polysaccharide biosynthesis/export family protein [Sphingomonas sp.]HEX4695436.1 polysaccharide biosynthesis/export family protein [Sphingomonas sp.]